MEILEHHLKEETPKADIDRRSRLDSNGKRLGGFVKYETSELRRETLLEDTCKTAKEYSLVKKVVDGQKEKIRVWEKVKKKDGDSKTKKKKKGAPKVLQQERYGYMLQNHCVLFRDEHEDLLGETIIDFDKEDADSDHIANEICVKELKICTPFQLDSFLRSTQTQIGDNSEL